MPATVLNVDDNPAKRYIRSRTLRNAGFQVIEAGTGEGALTAAREQHPSLLLLDIKLPDMSGLDVCREIRRDAWAKRVGIIHISATYLDIERESINAGADIYLAEPVDQQELLSAVRILVRLRGAEDRLVASEERMRLAMEAANIAAWDIDVATGEAVWSEQFYRLLGCTPGSVPATLAGWLERVAADERESFRAAIADAVEYGKPFVHEHWIERADDDGRRRVSVHGMLRRSHQSTPRRLIGVALDVTERRRAETEREQLLEQARAGQRAAEEASRIKDEFLATLSHELRTPLTAMLGWIELIRTGRLSEVQHAVALETVERNARLQVRLVNDLLDVSQIVAGKFELDLLPVDVERALTSAVESQRPAIGAKSIRLDFAMESGPIIVPGSEERLGQVFSNLLSNAIKFTREGGEIRVALRRSAATMSVEISDNGEGISAEALPHLFDRFWQVDSSNRRRHGGLGLGLAIVRSIVDMHGGTVHAASAGLGEGATFTVTLPLSSAARKSDGSAAGAAARRTSLSGIRILAVDDNADTLDMLSLVLQSEGATVKCALSGAAACDIATDWQPDVLVLDLALPGEDGFSLLKRLRALYRSDVSLPAVAVTGYAGEEQRQRVLKGGFQAHLAKPFSVDELVTLLGSLAHPDAEAR